MNVTVHVAAALRPAVEGRGKLELGVPPYADLGDFLQTLFKLYPRLAAHLPYEGGSPRLQLQLLVDPRSAVSRSLRLKEGQRLFLVADQPRRLVVQ